ncbi:hypothetical protein EOS93_10155 [Rhizobium sp. RMa-01]|uniref:hypothetical protein n=1 Tax=unclassified Rhizobium TaxID=2613769 RepID=UPI0008D9B064|nr:MULTISPECIES: hypothetical protein [unclassified Rhizobium]OHV26224.1 hypothetical protein BBJ66_05770 [Rhizobium sp. RSm-3]RVU11162.1 hypothetical protein EOS93_10155 [Rhizobium sp. RMa-01]
MENQSLTGEFPTEKVSEAALWLSRNADTIKGNPLLELMSRFHLSVLDAAEASRRAHRLRYAAGQTVASS